MSSLFTMPDNFSTFSIGIRLLAAYLAFIIARAIYRVTLHPLAKFPGPPLAGFSRLYAMSWDFPAETSYSKNFAHWHDKYGPIIRIEPNHLHIRDMDAYNEVFKVGTKFNRDPAIYGFPLTRGSFFNKLTVREGKVHRDLYIQYFSKINVTKMEYMIREHVANFLQRLNEAFEAGKVVDLTLGYRCLTADTLGRYAFDKPLGATDYPDFRFPALVNMEGFFDNASKSWYLVGFFSMVVDTFMAVPRSWIQWNPPLAAAIGLVDFCRARVKQLKLESHDNMAPSIFQTALHPKPEKGHPVLDDNALGADALTVFTAGTDTTGHAFVTGTWQLMNNPDKLNELRKALKEAIPDPDTMNLDWAALEKIDYLRAVVKESIRLSYGVPGKIPRVVPPNGATLVGQHIPGGTTVSMACYVYHQNPEYFERPSDFLPERWLDEKSAAENEKNFIAFSRGSRNCIGMNLAYAELYYGFAYIFRKFEMVRAEGMTDRDMDWHDAFVVATFGHLKVNLKKLEA